MHVRMYKAATAIQCATVEITAVIVFVKSAPKANVMGNVKLYITAVKKMTGKLALRTEACTRQLLLSIMLQCRLQL